MKYLFIIILISQDLILFNEEFLILICFIGFCWVFMENISTSISDYFKLKSSNLKSSILDSYNQVLLIYKTQLNLNAKILHLQIYFSNLKNYYINFNFEIAKKLNLVQHEKKKFLFKTKLHFTASLENQFWKLIVLLLIQKVRKVVILRKFFCNFLNIKSFRSIKKICLYEYISSI